MEGTHRDISMPMASQLFDGPFDSFHFVFHYPHITPIHYSSFHFTLQYPNMTPTLFLFLGVPGAALEATDALCVAGHLIFRAGKL